MRPFARSFQALVVALTALLPLGYSAAASAQQDPLVASLLATRAVDERVATIGYRLSIANLALCREVQWLPGFALHDLSQYGGDYRAAASRAFGLEGGAALLAVVAGGPAARAGLRADDALLRIDGQELPRLQPSRSFEPFERLLEGVEQAFEDGSAVLDVRRGGAPLSFRVAAERGCASRFQLVPSGRMNSYADGTYVQVTTALAQFAGDDQELAAILAHELAHNVLGHRARLDVAGVQRGFLGNFGRNARLIRQTEVEADRLSVHLLDRAGYDIEAPVRFWSRFGRAGLNFLGSPTHGSPGRRIDQFQAEIAAIRRSRAAGVEPVPPLAAGAARSR